MYFNILIFLFFVFLGKGFFSWDEEYLIAIGLFLVIYFLYSLLKSSLFNILSDQIDKISLKFMFFYSLNIIMLKILINSFKREFALKTSISYAYTYLLTFASEFSNLNKIYLLSVYKNNINYFLLKAIFYKFEFNKQFYLNSNLSKFSEINKFIFLLDKFFNSNSSKF